MAFMTSKIVALKNTAQVVEGAWAAIGSPVNVGNYDKIFVRPTISITAPQSVEFRIMERIVSATGSTFLPTIQQLGATGVGKLSTNEVTLDTFSTLYADGVNPVIEFDVQGLEWVELQTKSSLTTATGASISSVYYNFVKET